VLRNDQIQAAIIAYLKNQSDITDSLSPNDADEIREDQWQSKNFTYPNIRLRLISNDMDMAQCDLHSVLFSCLCFSEEYSSQQADEIAGIIGITLHERSFVSNTIAFTTTVTDLVPAIRIGEQTWRSEAILNAKVSG
jgi:hypothetical protein